MWNFLSLDDLNKHHKLSKEQSFTTFMDSLQIKVVEHDTLSLNELEKKIEAKFHSYEKRALVSTS